eukprot:TRINITY_DN6466_c2_g1_i1.p2 TRINITY_DN6466_c2_g1~~TRINITY_DN6466_c2_g1_i1.p2  ORF type:complete len:116 (-),score=38.33 TRINITY_DN6466_c2_g1_i1:207-554(-)
MNKPDSDEMFVLDVGEKKITVERDQRIQSAATFNIEKEDHTLGNLIRMQLLQNPAVLFAGYKVPHPLKYNVLVKVQTDHDQPIQAFKSAVSEVIKQTCDLQEQFKVRGRGCLRWR